MAEIMARERPRAVQIATVGDGSQAVWLRKWLGLPYLVYAHGNEILGALESADPKKVTALRRADRVLAVSRFTAGLVEKVGVAPERIAVVHPGCDAERFRPSAPDAALRQRWLGSRSRDRVVLTVGALVTRKGQDMVIRALPSVRRAVPDVTYVIVGEGPHRGPLEELARQVGVADQVVFAGAVDAKDLPPLYALSDVFAMPSREQERDVEGFGLVFLEASASGKPVVGGRSGGIPDALVEGRTGLLVDPQDPDDIAAALTRLLGDEPLARRLGEQGRARVVSDFTWAGVGDRVQAIVDAVVERRRQRSG